MLRIKNEPLFSSRRAFLKTMGFAPLVLTPAPFRGEALLFGSLAVPPSQTTQAPGFSDVRYQPHYPVASPLEDVLRMVAPGSDEFITEEYASQIESILKKWALRLKSSSKDFEPLAAALDPALEASPLVVTSDRTARTGGGITISKREFVTGFVHGRDRFLEALQNWLKPVAAVDTAEFEITGLQEITAGPLSVEAVIRYSIVGRRDDGKREERVGWWRTVWSQETSGDWKAQKWMVSQETVCVAEGPMFQDITSQALGGTDSYKRQMLRGSDHWRTVLDGACGIDVYGNNGIAAGDYDGDGFDDLYVCQPSGLPNRLYRNRGDGTFEDVTVKAGVGVLDNTSSAIFADFQNTGRQDLLLVCGGGPLLFLNLGDGTFSLKRDAFKFKSTPQGTFTHAAVADYDRDGRLDVYLCVYSYYLGLDQYHYPIPYYDARNGPPNFLMHNEGDGTFSDRTEASGLNAENDRYSFAAAWGVSGPSGQPDLYVANDFGRANFYRNKGDGTFTAASSEARVNEPGAGMSASWCDYDNDGKQDVYEADMWSAAGLRVSEQKVFHANTPEEIRENYQRHARGNSLYRNQGDGHFQDVSQQAGVAMGRWAWCSDFWDFDHDGFPDLYVTNGYISAPDREDLSSFFWRQVVARSPNDSSPSAAYEHGWNAINELIRSDRSWNGYERNVMYANNHDGTFSEVSGAAGLDFPEDSRSFVLADIDHDGRLEMVLKNRNAPQLRIMHNSMKELGASVAFRLKGSKSNRDGIGASVSIEVGDLRQTKYLQAGSGFVAQHTKELFFGLGTFQGPIRVTIRWPSGLTQTFQNVPANHRVAIDEGAAEFVAKPFAAASPAYTKPGPALKADALPTQTDTWLLEPLRAPAFSLPDLAGNTSEVRSRQGGCVLVVFWAASAPLSIEQLKMLQKKQATAAKGELEFIAVNLDHADSTEGARSLATREKFSFPILFATEEAAGVYNIFYRYLFDRRRNLAIPTSLLIDRQGQIVKVYQGPLDFDLLLQDARSVPTTADDRMRKALPFAGTSYLEAFERNDFTYGVALFQHGYLEQAAASFEQVIAEKPNDPEAYYNLGTLHLRRNDLRQASYYMEQAVKLRTNYPEAWNNLGMIAAQQGQAEQAERNFEQALSQRPNFAIALVNLGNFYRRQGKFDRAQTLLQRALELQPDDPETNYSVGMYYAQQEQVQSAANYLKRAIALRPGYPEALNNLGVLYTREKQYPEAEAQFKTCIQAAPNFDQSYMNLARLYVLQNDKQKAQEALQQLLRVQPEHPGAQQALEMLKSQP